MSNWSNLKVEFEIGSGPGTRQEPQASKIINFYFFSFLKYYLWWVFFFTMGFRYNLNFSNKMMSLDWIGIWESGFGIWERAWEREREHERESEWFVFVLVRERGGRRGNKIYDKLIIKIKFKRILYT